MEAADLEPEPKVLSSFEKLDETIDILKGILSLPLTEDPTASEDKTEEQEAQKIAYIVIGLIYLTSDCHKN